MSGEEPSSKMAVYELHLVQGGVDTCLSAHATEEAAREAYLYWQPIVRGILKVVRVEGELKVVDRDEDPARGLEALLAMEESFVRLKERILRRCGGDLSKVGEVLDSLEGGIGN